jgi:hypothetical protein
MHPGAADTVRTLMVLDFRGAVTGALPCQLMPAAPGAAHLMHGLRASWRAVCAADAASRRPGAGSAATWPPCSAAIRRMEFWPNAEPFEPPQNSKVRH